MKNNIFYKKIPYLEKIYLVSQKRKIDVWLVGGVLRDIYLKADKDLIDFDFCVEKNIRSFIVAVAKSIQAKVVVLDKKFPSFRLVISQNKKNYTYDFSAMRGKNIKEDLSLRDFTINTLAIKLDQPQEVLDYYQGAKDLKKKTIKALSEGVIVDDPLRILRGFSFSAQSGFRIEPKTLNFFCVHKGKIAKTSAERINEELFKIFASLSSYKIVRKMDEFKVIDEIMPYVERMRKTKQGGFHHLNVWDHSVETLKQFELLYKRRLVKRKEVSSYLNQPLAKGRKRIQILKMACLLHDLGKPFVKKKVKGQTKFHAHEKVSRDFCGKFAQKLRLSKNEKTSLEKMVFWHLRPGYLADQITPSLRAVYRFFRDTQAEGISIILLSLADWRATRGPLTNSAKRKSHEKVMLKLVEDFFVAKKKKPIPKIINGHDIMDYFKIKSGPLIGEALGKVRELQALGKIKKKKEALAQVGKMLERAKKINGLSKKNIKFKK